MQYQAKAFLFGAVQDPVVTQYTPLRDLPEPDYVRALCQELEARGVRYVHIVYWPEWRRIPTGSETWRAYRVQSFVWNSELYVIRNRFTNDDFARWPPELRAVWEEAQVSVPDELYRLQ